MSVRLVQLQRDAERRVAMVVDEDLRLLGEHETIYDLAQAAIKNGLALAHLAQQILSDERVSYAEVYEGRSPWRLCVAADHPVSTWRTMVSGTGLTHMASVARRDSMHAAMRSGQETDSMRMYRWGVEGGKPSNGTCGVAPEWFYKGNGTILRAHNEPLEIPEFAEDGGEEPEIAGVYLIDDAGTPRRIGFAIGNEFSDHQFESRNYLYLAHSKLRTCSIGPELLVDQEFDHVKGTVSIRRGDAVIWSSDIQTGESVMCHSLANMEHHHFKYPQHRIPGGLHIHFFGADAFSFGSGLKLQDGDWMEIAFEGFGRPLRNPVRVAKTEEKLRSATAL